MQIDVLKPIVEAVPLFRNIEDKEKFLIVVSALKLRLVSLAKASEIMHMTKTGFLELLESLDIDYSYLSETDIEVEKTWPDDSRF
jgi:predicted HTH domain antitoxin